MKKKQFLFLTLLFLSLFTFVACPFPFDGDLKYYTKTMAIDSLESWYGGKYEYKRSIKCSGDKKRYVFISSGGELPEGSEVHFCSDYDKYNSYFAPPIIPYSNGMALKYSAAESKYYNNLISGNGVEEKYFTNAKIIFNNSDRIFFTNDCDEAAKYHSDEVNKVTFCPPDYRHLWDENLFEECTDAYIFVGKEAGETDSEEQFLKHLKPFLGRLMNLGVHLEFEIFLLPDSVKVSEVTLLDATNKDFRKKCDAVYKTTTLYYLLSKITMIFVK